MAKLDELKQKLTAKQIQAAYLLVENELMESNNEEKRTQDEMANELGINRTTLWEWRTKSQDFIAFKSEVADSFLAEKREQVYSKLMHLILGPQPSVKAMQLYMQRFGLLTDKKVIEGNLGNATRTNAEIEEQLQKLKKLTGE
ncbi:TPA: phBC6A51 family helix-turn-helix protein [Bacillus cereus]